ncbi:MAG TPA: transposase [Bryobacteraceae bacterium]|nr:transposase [Bryobacteraceae bacterium]
MLSSVNWDKPHREPSLGRSRGGLRAKIHLLADECGLPVAFRLTGGRASDFRETTALLGDRETEAVIADKGYDSTSIVDHIHRLRARAVIPTRSRRKFQCCYDPKGCSKRLCSKWPYRS